MVHMIWWLNAVISKSLLFSCAINISTFFLIIFLLQIFPFPCVLELCLFLNSFFTAFKQAQALKNKTKKPHYPVFNFAAHQVPSFIFLHSFTSLFLTWDALIYCEESVTLPMRNLGFTLRKIYEIAFLFWFIWVIILKSSSTTVLELPLEFVFIIPPWPNDNLMISLFKFSNKECGFTNRLWEKSFALLISLPSSSLLPLSIPCHLALPSTILLKLEIDLLTVPTSDLAILRPIQKESA